MRRSKAVLLLSSLVAVLAAGAAGVGLFWRGGSDPRSFTTLHGEVVQLYGRGLYRNDTLFIGAGNRGTDVVTLAVGVPLLVCAILLYRRGSLRGALLLTGVLAYILYVYASLALGAAYHGLFLLSVALFSASLFAFVRLVTSIDVATLPAHISPRLPRRGVAAFMVVCGVVTLVVWLGMGLLPALTRGEPPKALDSYTTSVTDVLDLGIITPACFVTALLLVRRSAFGYVMAFALLGILVILGPVFAAQTVSQVSAGISYTPGEIIGPIGGFGSLSLLALWFLVLLLRNIADASPSLPRARGARAGDERITPRPEERVRRDATTAAAGSRH